MKAASASLIALLAAQQFLYADLYTFTLVDGTILRYTSADGDLVMSGNTYTGTGQQLSRGNTKTQIGVEVDTLDITILTNVTTLYNSLPVAQFAQQGGFDGARVQLSRVFMPTTSWGDTSAGALIMFVGRVAEVQCTRTTVQLSVNSDLELLNVALPRNIYQAGCVHTVYDAGCTLTAAAFTSTGNTTANSTASVINCNLAQANGYFNLGTVSYTSGSNANITRSVKSYVVGQLTTMQPFPFTPAAGDLISVKPGCDKTTTQCGVAKFNNLVNFRGYPYIPAPEASH